MGERIKAGSTVKYRPTGEEWFILGVNRERDRVCVAGWPPSEAMLSDCELIEEGNGITKKEREYRDREFGPNWDGEG